MPLAPSFVPRDFDTTTTATAQRLPRARHLRAPPRPWDLDATARFRCGAVLLLIMWLAAALSGYGSVLVYRLASGAPSSAVSPAFTSVVIIFVGLVSATAWLTLRVATAEDWWMPMRSVAEYFGGCLGAEPSRRGGWIERYWIAEGRAVDIRRSNHGGAISLVVRDYPVLVLFDPVPIGRARKARVEMLLAASFPELPLGGGGEVMREGAEWLARHGFTLRWSDAGLRASATAAAVAALDDLGGGSGERQDAAAQALVGVVEVLVVTAALLHAEPRGGDGRGSTSGSRGPTR